MSRTEATASEDTMDLCNLKELRPVLERNGFRFAHALGQNFLTDASVPRRIAEASGADASWGVLEIGPGVGCLTQELAARAGAVTAVELDKRLIPVLGETLADVPGVRIVCGDILRLNLPELVAESFPKLTPMVCANLPYNITSPVLTELLRCGLFRRVTVMIQREVADRLCAKPGSPEYGAFTVFVNYHAVAERLFDVPPSCFTPQPKVTSAVVRLELRETPPCGGDEALLFRVVRAAFSQRRKTLANSLTAAFGTLGRAELEERIRRAGVEPGVRGETLSLPEFAALAETLGETP